MGFFGMAMSYIFFSVVHFCLLVLALVVAGLYGQDLDNARKEHAYADGKWVYAVVVAGLSAVTALLYFLPFILRFAFVWVWSFILFVLWIVLFGIFGQMYIHANPQGDAGIERMKNAVWIDLVNALGWLLLAIGSFLYWRSHRERHTRFTGRARV